MAALQLRAPPPSAVAAASRISRPFHGAMNAHPLCRRGPSSAPVKFQARTRDSFRFHCDKRADRINEPDPEVENHDPDKAATPQKQNNHPLVEELLNYKQTLLAAMGVRVPPDMFFKEKERISDYMMKLSRSADSGWSLDERVVSEIVCSRTKEALDLASDVMRVPPDMFIKEKERISDFKMKMSGSADSRNLNERVVAKLVCSRAWEALDLASKVMDIAHDGPGTVEFSQHTTDQMVRTYATILYNVADDAYHKKIGTETILSFLGALRGLGAICHILVQDTVAKLKDGHLKNKIAYHMDTHSQEFYKKVNNLEDEVAKIKEQELQKMVTTMLLYGLEYAHLYIFQLIEGRNLALDYLTSKE